jgi:hypothetical protein
MIIVQKFDRSQHEQWNKFVSDSKNGTFLFSRDFLDYHKNRFNEFSLMVYENDVLVCVLPAVLQDDNTLVSHPGLTYGGFVLSSKSSTVRNASYVKSIFAFLEKNGVETLRIKHLPDFYSLVSQNELEYVYFLLEAKLERMDTALVVDLESSELRKMPKGRKSEIKKAEKMEVKVVESDSLDYFWNNVLSPNLRKRFDVAPVHSLPEINSLQSSFPNNIKLFQAIYNDEVVAGTLVFVTKNTAHLQYIASTDKGRETGGLDYLFHYLIQYYKGKKQYFDFGIVNEKGGREVNLGMLKWKESFGSRVFLHRFYSIETRNHVNLKMF